MKINLTKFYKIFYPATIAILALIVIFFYVKSINYYHQSQMAAEKIRAFIKEVALKKVEKEKAQAVLDFIKTDLSPDLNLSTTTNPFKKIEKEADIEE